MSTVSLQSTISRTTTEVSQTKRQNVLRTAAQVLVKPYSLLYSLRSGALAAMFLRDSKKYRDPQSQKSRE